LYHWFIQKEKILRWKKPVISFGTAQPSSPSSRILRGEELIPQNADPFVEKIG
jgi:hypothetical protein